MQDGVGHREVRVDDAGEQAQLGGDFDVLGLGDLGGGEADAEALGHQAADDVQFVGAGRGDVGHAFGVADAGQSLALQGVALDDQGAAELLGTVVGAAGVFFDEDGRHARFFEPAGQLEPEFAAARHDDALEALVLGPSPLQEGRDGVGFAGEIDVVAHQEGGVAVGGEDFVAAGDGQEADPADPFRVAVSGKGVAEQRAVHVDGHADDDDPAVQDVGDLDGAGEAEDRTDVAGVFVVLVDEEVDAEFREVDVAAGHVAGGGHPGGRALDAAGLREDAGEQVGVVAVGHRHEEIGAADAGFLQHLGIGAVAAHGQQVEAGVERGEGVGGFVHDHDVVPVLAESFREVGAGHAAADEKDAHRSPPTKE